jgi:hypothetical protein
MRAAGVPGLVAIAAETGVCVVPGLVNFTAPDPCAALRPDPPPPPYPMAVPGATAFRGSATLNLAAAAAGEGWKTKCPRAAPDAQHPGSEDGFSDQIGDQNHGQEHQAKENKENFGNASGAGCQPGVTQRPRHKRDEKKNEGPSQHDGRSLPGRGLRCVRNAKPEPQVPARVEHGRGTDSDPMAQGGSGDRNLSGSSSLLEQWRRLGLSTPLGRRR